ncbi:MAG: histidinol-phosphate transaminase [Dichotomicrobium sp.]
MPLKEKVQPAAAPQPRPGLMDVPPYVPGKSKLADGGPVIKLSSNETPLGPSPRAVEAYRAAAANMERYPDGGATALREALAARHELDAARIVCGAGSDELFHLLAQAYLGPGDEAIYTAHGFLVYPIVIMASGATPVVAPEREFRADIDAILAAVTPRTKAVFLANPNNPTGTYLTSAEVRRLRAELPGHVLLVLDGAYAEYAPADYDDGAGLAEETGNTVVTRTFSKLHGLASARVGWAYCPADIAAVLNRIRSPFNVSGPGMAAAVASVEDRAHTDAAVAHNTEWRDWLTAELRGAGVPVTESAANFVLTHFDPDGPKTTEAADAWLQDRRIIVRRLEAYGLPDALRISIGRDEDNRAVARALKEFMDN